MGVFGLLTALCFISFIHLSDKNIFSNNAFLWSGIVCIIYGASDEFHQYFVPNRSSELQDLLADIAGVLIMLLLIKYVLINRMKLFQKAEYNGA